MASPQLEDGYIRIANELQEAIARYEFTGRERSVMDVVIRQTYGFNRKSAPLTSSDITRFTGISRPTAGRILKSLIDVHVLTRAVVVNGTGVVYSYCFNKRYLEWEVLSRMERVVIEVTGCNRYDNRKVLHPRQRNKRQYIDNLTEHKLDLKDKDPPNPPEGDSDQEKSGKKKTPIDYQKYLTSWNYVAEQCAWSQVKILNEGRKKKIKVRCAEEAFDWKAILEKARTSRGLRGQGWFNLDWLITNDTNYLKVLEGKYEKPFGGDRQPPDRDPPPRLDPTKLGDL